MSRNKLNFYLNDQLVGNANNWQGISISLDFDNENVQASIETDSLEFVLTESNIIRKWIQDGVDGTGPGIYEPMELRIEMASNGNTLDVFVGLLDMVNDMQFIDKNKVLVKLIKKGGLDQLTQRSQAISFAFLAAKGEITSSDFVDVAYIQAHIPNFRELLLVGISIFILIKEIREQIKRIIDTIATISGIAVSGVTGPIGALILAIATLITEIIYIIFITIALKQLMVQLIALLVGPIRFHKAMRLRVLLEKGAAHLGYTFESSEFNDIIFNTLVIIPIKEREPAKPPFSFLNKGFPTNKGGLYTYFEMLQFYKKLINGKIVVRDNKIIIERRDFFDNLTSFVLPKVELPESRFNAEEINGNLNIEFLIDEKDDTTLVNYLGNLTTFQRITEPKIIVDKQNVQIKGLEQVSLPVSLPTRKNSLTRVESLLLGLARLVDTFVGGNFFSSQITGRFGALSLGNDFTGVPKITPLVGNKIPVGVRNIMSAKVLHDKYYFINSFVSDTVNRNQFRRHEEVKIPFCFEDYITLAENNGFTTQDGREGRFEKIEGNPDAGFATVDIRIKEVFTRNLKDQLV